MNYIWIVRKTDKRMAGFNLFEFVASPKIKTNSLYITPDRYDKYCSMLIEARNWCWTTWGPGCELDIHKLKNMDNELNKIITDRWCWQTDYNNHKILLKTEKEANWFKLRWQ